MVLNGLDVSHHQGFVDYGAVAASGQADFVICKATDGLAYDWVGYYLDTIAAVRRVGLPAGAYHWLRAGPNGELRDPRGQARYFLSVIGDPTGLICGLDVEVLRNKAGTIVSAPNIHSVEAFYDEWNRLTGGHPLPLYTGKWYWVGHIGNPDGAHLTPYLWHSEYETTDLEIADGPELDAYGGWAGCTIWQYTSSGRIPGAAGSVDRNLFFGDRAALRALAGLAPALPTTPVSSKEDPMIELHASKWTGVNLLDASGATWVSDPATVDEQVRQGTPVRRMDANESDARRFIAERTAGVDEQIAASLDMLVRVGQATHDDLVAIEKAIRDTYARIVGPQPEPV